MEEKLTQELNYKLETLLRDKLFSPPGIGVIAYRDGEEVYSFFKGHRALKINNRGKNRPMTRNSRFRIASVSKMFTIFTILQLAEEKKLNLDDDVSKYLGFMLRNPKHKNIPITLRMLANHTSSIRDGRVYSIPPTKSLREFFVPNGEYFENGAHFATENEPPQKYFTYCNLNYGILGTVIEAVTNERFDKYQKEHILKQLNIMGDYVPGNFSEAEFDKLGTIYQKQDDFGNWYGTADDFQGIKPKRETLALQNPYDEKAQGVYSLETYTLGQNATIFSPTGGLRVSVEELAHALEMIMNNGNYKGEQVLLPESVELMFKVEWAYSANKKNGDTCGGTILSYGLGAYHMLGNSAARMSQNEKINLAGHLGEAFGLFSALCHRPNTKDGFVYVMNGSAIDIEDSQAVGRFSNNYLWEEAVSDTICRLFYTTLS